MVEPLRKWLRQASHAGGNGTRCSERKASRARVIPERDAAGRRSSHCRNHVTRRLRNFPKMARFGDPGQLPTTPLLPRC